MASDLLIYKVIELIAQTLGSVVKMMTKSKTLEEQSLSTIENIMKDNIQLEN